MVASVAVVVGKPVVTATTPEAAPRILNVTANLPTAGPVRVELFDAPGLYVLRLTPPTGPVLSRQVVRE